MNASFIVTFKHFAEGRAYTLERMLRQDIAAYPDRMSMASATVEGPYDPERKRKSRTVKSATREGTVSRDAVTEAVKKVKEDGES